MKNIRYSFPLMFLLVLNILGQSFAEDPKADVLETYIFPGADLEVLFSQGGSSRSEQGEDPFGKNKSAGTRDARALFMTFGVGFPEGSSIRYESLISSVIMTNTRENQRKLYEILNKSGVAIEQAKITFQVFSVPEKIIQEEERKKGEPLHDEEILSFWKEGKASVLLSQSALALNGVSTVMEAAVANSSEKIDSSLVLKIVVTVSPDETHMTVRLITSSGKEDVKDRNARPVFPNLDTTIYLSNGEHIPVAHTSTGEGERRYLMLHGRIRKPAPVPFEELRLLPAP